MDQESSSNTAKFKDHIKEGNDGNIVIFGFPHDLGARAAGKNFGQEYGPDCMRRFLPNTGPIYNPEYDIDISSVRITDYGNIELSEDKTLVNLQNKLCLKMAKAFENNSFPIVIGGSKDVIYGSLQALKNTDKEGGTKTGLIAIQKLCDVSKYDKVEELNSTNGLLTFLRENENYLQRVIYFASEKYDNNIETNKFKHDFKNLLKFVHYEEVKKSPSEIKSSLDETSTKGGTLFNQNLEELRANCERVHLSISLEALSGSDCPGVCYKSKQGLSSEEILEILYQAGKNPLVCSLDITDYCPGSEDFRTGILLCNMIYYFTMGYKKRQ